MLICCSYLYVNLEERPTWFVTCLGLEGFSDVSQY
jgi:hypothetical protein